MAEVDTYLTSLIEMLLRSTMDVDIKKRIEDMKSQMKNVDNNELLKIIQNPDFEKLPPELKAYIFKLTQK